VAQQPVDIKQYREELGKPFGQGLRSDARHDQQGAAGAQAVVFTEGEEGKILRACQILLDEKIALPILLATRRRSAQDRGVASPLDGAQIVDRTIRAHRRVHRGVLQSAQRKGITHRAEKTIRNATTFGSMMVRLNDADALIGGLTTHYPDTIRPVCSNRCPARVAQSGRRVRDDHAEGPHLLPGRRHVNIEPTAEDLAEIAIMAARRRGASTGARVAMLSFSNFGSTHHALSEKVRRRGAGPPEAPG